MYDCQEEWAVADGLSARAISGFASSTGAGGYRSVQTTICEACRGGRYHLTSCSHNWVAPLSLSRAGAYPSPASGVCGGAEHHPFSRLAARRTACGHVCFALCCSCISGGGVTSPTESILDTLEEQATIPAVAAGADQAPTMVFARRVRNTLNR